MKPLDDISAKEAQLLRFLDNVRRQLPRYRFSFCLANFGSSPALVRQRKPTTEVKVYLHAYLKLLREVSDLELTQGRKIKPKILSYLEEFPVMAFLIEKVSTPHQTPPKKPKKASPAPANGPTNKSNELPSLSARRNTLDVDFQMGVNLEANANQLGLRPSKPKILAAEDAVDRCSGRRSPSGGAQRGPRNPGGSRGQVVPGLSQTLMERPSQSREKALLKPAQGPGRLDRSPRGAEKRPCNRRHIDELRKDLCVNEVGRLTQHFLLSQANDEMVPLFQKIIEFVEALKKEAESKKLQELGQRIKHFQQLVEGEKQSWSIEGGQPKGSAEQGGSLDEAQEASTGHQTGEESPQEVSPQARWPRGSQGGKENIEGGDRLRQRGRKSFLCPLRRAKANATADLVVDSLENPIKNCPIEKYLLLEDSIAKAQKKYGNFSPTFQKHCEMFGDLNATCLMIRDK